MNKFIGLFSACVMFISLSFNAYASDDNLTVKPSSVKSSSYTRFGGVPEFSRDYYDSLYNNTCPDYMYYHRNTYTPINQSPYYNQNIPSSAVKNKYDDRDAMYPFGTKPTYTPINQAPYYNQNIPKDAIKNDKNNHYDGTYPWNVKYTYTPANQIKK